MCLLSTPMQNKRWELFDFSGFSIALRLALWLNGTSEWTYDDGKNSFFEHQNIHFWKQKIMNSMIVPVLCEIIICTKLHHFRVKTNGEWCFWYKQSHNDIRLDQSGNGLVFCARRNYTHIRVYTPATSTISAAVCANAKCDRTDIERGQEWQMLSPNVSSSFRTSW